jgi:hypothetical protein
MEATNVAGPLRAYISSNHSPAEVIYSSNAILVNSLSIHITINIIELGVEILLLQPIVIKRRCCCLFVLLWYDMVGYQIGCHFSIN